VAVALALAAPAPAPATTTRIGSDLSATPDQFQGGGPGTLFLQSQLFSNRLTAPTSGVVVRWRIKTAAGPIATFKLRVLHPDPGGGPQFTATGSTAAHESSASGGLETMDTRIPIAAGDYVGMQLTDTAVWRRVGLGPDAGEKIWVPPLADGETRSPDADHPDEGVEYFYNADVETDADADGYGDDSQDNCPAVANPDQADFNHQGDGDACEPPRQGSCANFFGGTTLSERLTGSSFGDSLVGFGGHDLIRALGGNDCADGGPGNDRLYGGDGHDLLIGGRGNDRLGGGDGRDRLYGRRGADVLTGGRGRNRYYGGPGRDRIQARNGVRETTIDCGPGRDVALVEAGDVTRRCEIVAATP
jgi:Ca2+-binding RTX toxin-like protein